MQIENLEGQESIFGRDSGSGKMSSVLSQVGGTLKRVKKSLGRIFKKSSKRSSKLKNHTFMLLDLRPGAGNMLGAYWEYDPPWLGSFGMLNTSECPKDAVECSLWQILQATAPSRYSLSQTACLGILRRAACRGKSLPPLLEVALRMQAGLDPPAPISGEAKAYHINQRNEGIDLDGVSGALMATQNLQMQTFITNPSSSQNGPQTQIAFAANQRDEVRDLHDVAAALAAQPGMKQQTFVAGITAKGNGDCFLSEERHTSLSGGGGMPGQGYPAIFTAGFSAGQGSAAGGIGFQTECSPTLKASESGSNMVPSILCLNDQGGSVMACSEDVAGTLRAQEHGHQPLIVDKRSDEMMPALYENHGIDARYTGPHTVAPTMSARYGTGGNNVPLIAQGSEPCQESSHAIFSRQRVDVFREDAVASTQSARQHKDATDLVMDVAGLDCRNGRENGDLCGTLQQGTTGSSLNSIHPVRTGRLIRRLTPLECERLQGFPDHWTELPDASDSARYKALGNSVAIPCVNFVLRGIAYFLRWKEENHP